MSNIGKIRDIQKSPKWKKDCLIEGVLAGKRTLATYHSNKMMIGVLIEDESYWADLVVYPELFAKHSDLLKLGVKIHVRGKLTSKQGHLTIHATDLFMPDQ